MATAEKKKKQTHYASKSRKLIREHNGESTNQKTERNDDSPGIGLDRGGQASIAAWSRIKQRSGSRTEKSDQN